MMVVSIFQWIKNYAWIMSLKYCHFLKICLNYLNNRNKQSSELSKVESSIARSGVFQEFFTKILTDLFTRNSWLIEKWKSPSYSKLNSLNRTVEPGLCKVPPSRQKVYIIQVFYIIQVSNLLLNQLVYHIKSQV